VAAGAINVSPSAMHLRRHAQNGMAIDRTSPASPVRDSFPAAAMPLQNLQSSPPLFEGPGLVPPGFDTPRDVSVASDLDTRRASLSPTSETMKQASQPAAAVHRRWPAIRKSFISYQLPWGPKPHIVDMPAAIAGIVQLGNRTERFRDWGRGSTSPPAGQLSRRMGVVIFTALLTGASTIIAEPDYRLVQVDGSSGSHARRFAPGWRGLHPQAFAGKHFRF